MLLLKYTLSITCWGLLTVAAVNVFRNLYWVVQYHRQLRHIAPGSLSGISSGPEGAPTEPPSTHGGHVEKPQLNWTSAKWAFLAAWLPLTLATGIVVMPSGMGGIRVSQTAGTRPGNQFPPEIQPGRRLRRDGTPGPVEGLLPLIHAEHTMKGETGWIWESRQRPATSPGFSLSYTFSSITVDQCNEWFRSFSPIANCSFFQSNEGYSHFLEQC